MYPFRATLDVAASLFVLVVPVSQTVARTDAGVGGAEAGATYDNDHFVAHSDRFFPGC